MPSAAATPGAGSAVRSTCSPGVPQTARPRSSAAIGRSARVGEVAGAALEQHAVAGDQRALGRERRGVVLDEVDGVGLERIAAGGAERGQQVVAGGAVEAGQREPLEDAAEAALGLQLSSPVNAACCEPARSTHAR